MLPGDKKKEPRSTLAKLPPFARQRPVAPQRSELKHIGLCLLVCVPTCATVCIILDRVLGG